MQLYINDFSKAQIKSYLAGPGQGLLLSGAKGTGLDTVTGYIALKLAGSPNRTMHVTAEKAGITIEQVRQLYVATRNSMSPLITRQVVVLHDVELMAKPAQNAFLKLLEEPPASTYFILTSHQPQLLLSTVKSRLQAINLLPINSEDSESLLNMYGLSKEISQQIIFIANGLPAELARLGADPEYRLRAFNDAKLAKQLVGGSTFNRLIVASKITSDRNQALRILNLAAKMCQFKLGKRIDQQTVSLLDELIAASEAIAANGNVKAQLLKICTPG